MVYHSNEGEIILQQIGHVRCQRGLPFEMGFEVTLSVLKPACAANWKMNFIGFSVIICVYIMVRFQYYIASLMLHMQHVKILRTIFAFQATNQMFSSA